MPIVNIQMLEGRTKEQKDALLKDVTAAVVKNTGAPIENVNVIISEIPHGNLATAGNIR